MTGTYLLLAILIAVSGPLCYFALFAVQRWSARIGLVAVPNERSSHTTPVATTTIERR